MIRHNQRFRNQLDDHLIHLHKNLFISHSDPLYHEKVIRYLDAHSPEAHYNLGQKFQTKGNWQRARFHYAEVLKTYPSPFYSAANRAIHDLDQRHASHVASLEQAFPTRKKPLLPPFMKMLLAVLLIINVVLVLLFAGSPSIPRLVSHLKVWGVGSEVTYETVDKPFMLYISPDAPHAEIEQALHKQAVTLAKDMPKANIIIYGIVTSDPADKGKTMLLSNEDVIQQAIVVATYHPETDASVHIRFLNGEFKEHQPLSAFGANLVRTALETYRKDMGHVPAQIDELMRDYPANYLSFIPTEAISGSNQVVADYDGYGGWIYNPAAGDMAHMFYPNIAEMTEISYAPVHIVVNKAEHEVKLVSGNLLLWQKPIGLGAGGSTPEGDYRVVDRVLQPMGKTTQSYGTAGLGLGAIALHGTYDESSIGNDKSFGCIRLTNADMESLFPFVPKGAEVRILSTSSSTLIHSTIVNVMNQAPSLIPSNMPKHVESSEGVVFHWLG
ncbi:L,D-transpeptidase family protein [Paenibacillus roseipurpureus]|uniref:L,D-transpeptidase family protein n=1 Tax=Paenibacillus roseopurpureus TaxID=2918901 RepID=A0AA96LJU1_9BACL|nr:L,D-transpeptidase family protein [Paenibacillus sp. MBLB1832]WNR42179.1 L,D-transpeptidase family protein [Paenibacillus sp. MBLB1832]